MKRFNWIICCFVSCIIILSMAAPVAANGAPVKIFLNYLPEFSNYGPTDASGVASVSIGEAWVDLSADGLPQLTGELYEAWLIKAEPEGRSASSGDGPAPGEMISLGKFNSDANGSIAYYAELGQLPIVDYRYFVISVEPDPDPSPEADARLTIAGVFPNPKLQIVSSTPTASPEPDITPTPEAPAELPVTGGRGIHTWLLVGAASIIALGLGVVTRASQIEKWRERAVVIPSSDVASHTTEKE